MTKATTLTLRKNNRRRIYQYVYESPTPVTKQEIAQKLDLSLPTVSTNLAEFLEDGLLTYSGTFASTGGRKPRAISPVESARFSVGVSIMDDAVRLVAIDLRANELAYRKLYRPFVNEDGYYRWIAEALEEFLDEKALDRALLLGVGITIPGIVDQDRELVVFAPTLGLRNKKMAAIKSCFPYPVNVENDANASGYAEWWGHLDVKNIAYLSVERGVGGAILMDGHSYAGDHSRSGEFGHFCIVPDGRPCRCGQRGCFESYCSTSRLGDDLGLSLDEFFDMLSHGNEQIALTWQNYLKHLARGIANIRVVFDCDIVIGGALASHLDGYLDDLRRQVVALSSFDADGGFLRLSRFKSHSACVGAALHFVGRFIQEI